MNGTEYCDIVRKYKDSTRPALQMEPNYNKLRLARPNLELESIYVTGIFYCSRVCTYTVVHIVTIVRKKNVWR